MSDNGNMDTRNRKAMRHDTQLVLTPLGNMIADELKLRRIA